MRFFPDNNPVAYYRTIRILDAFEDFVRAFACRPHVFVIAAVFGISERFITPAWHIGFVGNNVPILANRTNGLKFSVAA